MATPGGSLQSETPGQKERRGVQKSTFYSETPSPLTSHPPPTRGHYAEPRPESSSHDTTAQTTGRSVAGERVPAPGTQGCKRAPAGRHRGDPPPPPGATGMLPPEARDPLEKSGRACTAPPPPGRPALTRRDGYSMRARGRPPACDPEPAALLTQLDLASAGARLHASAKQSAESGSAGPNTATQPTATAPPPARRPPAAGAAPAATFLFWCGEGRGREADAPGLRHFRSPGPTNQKRPRVGGRPRPGVPPGAWRGPRAPTGPGPGDLKA